MAAASKTLAAVNDELRTGGHDQWTKVGIQLVGTPVGATVQFESAIDGTNWVATSATPSAGGAAVTSAGAAGLWVAEVSGFTYFRARLSAITSGNFVVSLQPAI